MTIITCGLCGHTGDKFELVSCADEYKCPACGEVIEVEFESDYNEGDDDDYDDDYWCCDRND